MMSLSLAVFFCFCHRVSPTTVTVGRRGDLFNNCFGWYLWTSSMPVLLWFQTWNGRNIDRNLAQDLPREMRSFIMYNHRALTSPTAKIPKMLLKRIQVLIILDMWFTVPNCINNADEIQVQVCFSFNLLEPASTLWSESVAFLTLCY